MILRLIMPDGITIGWMGKDSVKKDNRKQCGTFFDRYRHYLQFLFILPAA